MDKEIRLEQKNKELIDKIKFNEKSRRKMQQSLMKQINDLEQQCKKQKEVIDKAEKILNECKLLMPHEFNWGEQVDNALDILNEVSE